MPTKRSLNREETDFFNSMKPKDLTRDKIKELFAKRLNTPTPYQPDDTFLLQLNIFERLSTPFANTSKETIRTTVGRFLFNLYMNKDSHVFYDLFGYLNETLNGKAISKLDNAYSLAVINQKVTTENYIEYLNNRDNLAYFVVNFLASSMTLQATIPLPKVTKRKDELFKKYAKEIEAGDVSTVSKIETELLDLAAKELEGNAGLDTFESGARGTFGNNYKNSSIMRGTMFSSDGSGKISVSKANLVDGIPQDEIPFYNGMSIYSFYSKGVETQQGGLNQ